MWLPAGVPISSSKKAPDATRSMSVQVSRQAARTQGVDAEKVATAIATAVSARHDPNAPATSPTPTPRS